MLICLEMPLFALGHAYAFSPKDYIDPFSRYQSRLPVIYALRDAIGMYDVISDSLTTIRGTGYGYQTFEPSEGVMHQGLGRDRRVRAGLRYTQGGKAKYWLPLRGTPEASREGMWARHQGPAQQIRRWLDKKRMEREGYAPLLSEEIREAVHDDPDLESGSAISHDRQQDPLGVYQTAAPDGDSGKRQSDGSEPSTLFGKARQWASDHAQASIDYLDQAGDVNYDFDDTASLGFSDVESNSEQERLYEKSRALAHGDYAFPAVDVQEEEARRKRWEEDESMLQRYRAQKGQRARVGRALGRKEDPSESSPSDQADGRPKGNNDVPKGSNSATSAPTEANAHGVVDLLVEDSQAEERERLRERRRGDPALRAGGRTRVFRRQWESKDADAPDPSSSDSLSHASGSKLRPAMEPEEMPASKRPKSSTSAAGRKKDREATIQADAQRTQHPDANYVAGASRHIDEPQIKHNDGGQSSSGPQADAERPVETVEEGDAMPVSELVDIEERDATTHSDS